MNVGLLQEVLGEGAKSQEAAEKHTAAAPAFPLQLHLHKPRFPQVSDARVWGSLELSEAMCAEVLSMYPVPS